MTRTNKEILMNITDAIMENLLSIGEELNGADEYIPERDRVIYVVNELRDVLDSIEDDIGDHIEPDDYEADNN